MSSTAKIVQRLGDPVFYRKHFRNLVRPLRRRPGDDSSTLCRSVSGLGKVDSAAVIIAHPDDETFCSGLICELAAVGVPLRLVCLTRGEGGPTGGVSREELGGVRERELRAAAEVLGIQEVVFLDHPDPMAKKYRVYAPAVTVKALAAQIAPALSGADLVVSHGSSGEYWHPAHLLVHRATKRALCGMHVQEVRWLTFQARQHSPPIPKLMNRDDAAFLALDVTGWSGKREEALRCHRSQLGLFGRFAGGDHRDFIRKTGMEFYALQSSSPRFPVDLMKIFSRTPNPSLKRSSPMEC